jgi:hypothetical protein
MQVRLLGQELLRARLDRGEVSVVEVEERQRAASHLGRGVGAPDARNGVVGFGGRASGHVDAGARVVEDARQLVSNASGGARDEHDAARLGRQIGFSERGAGTGTQLRPEALERVHGECGFVGKFPLYERTGRGQSLQRDVSSI